ncbi:MAG: hypothetical protein KOO60_07455 [Gemmatimonadales bacterium]|nr:hypothetical protein [Gemmatimonadales bacterium]
MAAGSGKYCSVQYGSTPIANVTDWSINASSDIAPATSVLEVIGAWSDSYGTYDVGDVVTYSGAVYECHTSHTAAVGKEPTETAYWNASPGVESYTAGIKRWEASVTAYVDSAGLEPSIEGDLVDTSTSTLDVYYQSPGLSGKMLTGSVWLRNAQPSTDVNGNAVINYSFIGDGTLTEQTDPT